MGHDLRTPLAAIRLSGEFIEDDKVRERLSCEVDELQAVTENILLAARMNHSSGEALLESVTSKRRSPLEPIHIPTRHAPDD